jgi:hypothetical protein
MVRLSSIVSAALVGGASLPDAPSAGRVVLACIDHGTIADPAVARVDSVSVLVCPFCLGGDVMTQWLAEAPAEGP